MKVAAILSDAAYGRLKEILLDRTGLAYYVDKDEDLATRIGRRLAARAAPNCSEYLRILENGHSGEEEMDMLISELTIGETYLFRHAEHWEALRTTVFPDLLERNRSERRLRIWSAGCATGAEPYSLALLLKRELAESVAGWDISILATDINRQFLAQAREARFDDWAFREASADLRADCFRRNGKHWELRPEYRQWVRFQYQNLVRDPIHPAAYDLIVCRNVMIYFSVETMRAMAARFHDALADGGWLLVGHAEPNGEVFNAFRTVMASGITVYQKAEAAPLLKEAPAPAFTLPPAPPPPPVRRSSPRPVQRRPPPPDLEEVRRLADRGQWEAAISRCRILLAAQGLNPAAHFTFALILEHAGALEEAEQSLRRAIYLDREFALAHYHLGVSLEKNRRTDQARQAFANVLELLERRPAGDPLEHGDGITAAELKELAKMHLELLR